MDNIIKHKPGCSSNINCAVYHEDGICPGYRECDCQVANLQGNIIDTSYVAGIARLESRIASLESDMAEIKKVIRI